MLSERKRLYLLILIMVLITFSSVGLSLYSLYETMLEDKKQQLEGLVTRQARLFESVAAVDLIHFRRMGESEDEAFAYTLGQFKETFESYYGSDKTGEIVLATLSNKAIVFLLSGRNGKLTENSTLPLELEHLAAPMRRALRGESGMMSRSTAGSFSR